MQKQFVSNSKESNRIFKNDFLERCSRVHYSIPLIVFVPVILFFGWKALFVAKDNIFVFGGLFISGALAWTLTEYIIHRYLFHYEPVSDWGKRLHFLAHGVHHDFPNDHMRLVLPPSLSIPLAIVIYYFFSLLFTTAHLYAFFPGFAAGYLGYDMIHYALHHANFKSGYWKRLKQKHMIHHYSDHDKGYGVSTPIWDIVFRTEVEKKR